MACLTEINFSDLTNGKVVTNGTEMEWNGSGVFDKLMAAVNKNIKIQYDEGKIKGVDYANVYYKYQYFCYRYMFKLCS